MKHAIAVLYSHENSPEHLKNVASWKELAIQLKQDTTIDKKEQVLFESEQSRWRAVLTQLVAIVQSLAVRNTALRGKTERHHSPSNGSFLKEVELLAQFDPVMTDHVYKIETQTIQQRITRAWAKPFRMS